MQDFASRAGAFGAHLGAEQLESFRIYAAKLSAWNEKANLTAITDQDDVYLKHFLDSLSVLKALPEGPLRLIDIGSGAGFPGLPLKVARPELDTTLAEAVGKKVEFLEHMIATLKLSGIHTIHSRAEDLGRNPEYREAFDVAAARAVASLPILAEYALPLVKVGGIFIAQKSLDAESVQDAELAFTELGGSAAETLPVEIDGLDPRQLVIVRKIKPTPEKYPRRTGMPSKRPL